MLSINKTKNVLLNNFMAAAIAFFSKHFSKIIRWINRLISSSPNIFMEFLRHYITIYYHPVHSASVHNFLASACNKTGTPLRTGKASLSVSHINSLSRDLYIKGPLHNGHTSIASNFFFIDLAYALAVVTTLHPAAIQAHWKNPPARLTPRHFPIKGVHI